MSAIQCHECRFFDGTVPDLGFCRRYAPTVHTKAPPSDYVARWPTVEFDDWCGEFSPEQVVTE